MTRIIACAVCGEPDRSQDPLIPDEFYPDEAIHLHCLNSAEGKRWHEERQARDPGYARYMSLITVRRQVTCPGCGSDENWLSQKSSGFSPSFELCCTQCDEVSRGLSPYEAPVTGPLSDLQHDFVLGRNVERIDSAIERLSREHRERRGEERCKCGGSFSIAAKPRCHRCRSVLADTFFHYNDVRPS